MILVVDKQAMMYHIHLMDLRKQIVSLDLSNTWYNMALPHLACSAIVLIHQETNAERH